jgi:hypothetical protein
MVIVAVFENCGDNSIFRAQQRVTDSLADVPRDPDSRTHTLAGPKPTADGGILTNPTIRADESLDAAPTPASTAIAISRMVEVGPALAVG